MYARRRKRGLCVFPGYKWCGPGCSGPGAPINDVDACCYKHDKCLSSGRSRCYCDRAFLSCLYPKINRQTDKGRKAATMYKYMQIQTIFTCGIERDNRRY
ncbi:phospholipase [Lederbergia graminis]|uniref:Phospholipase n=1 Tax=Lederbergia graminis TaxID=735518 RepID=A0ABW0LC72_9BACI